MNVKGERIWVVSWDAEGLCLEIYLQIAGCGMTERGSCGV